MQRRIDVAEEKIATRDFDGAIAAYRDILARLPALTSIQLRLGELYELKQDIAGALTAYRELARVDPTNEPARAAIRRLGGQQR